MTDFLASFLAPYKAAMTGAPQPLPDFGLKPVSSGASPSTPTSAAAAGGSLADWVHQAMSITGVSPDWFSGLMKLAQYESGGNPNAYNDTPVASGQHAQGLFQTIPTTFQAHNIEGLGPITNPIANAVAAIRYILGRYGSVYETPLFTEGGGGY